MIGKNQYFREPGNREKRSIELKSKYFLNGLMAASPGGITWSITYNIGEQIGGHFNKKWNVNATKILIINTAIINGKARQIILKIRWMQRFNEFAHTHENWPPSEVLPHTPGYVAEKNGDCKSAVQTEIFLMISPVLPITFWIVLWFALLLPPTVYEALLCRVTFVNVYWIVKGIFPNQSLLSVLMFGRKYLKIY